MRNNVRLSGFVRNLVQILKGTVVGQMISVVTLPLLTRLFSTESFAILGLVNTLCGALGPSAAGRLDVAAAVNDNQSDRDKLSAAAIWFTFIYCLLIWFIYRSLSTVPYFHHNLEKYIELGFLGPISIFIFACVQIGRYSANGRSDFSLLGISAIIMAISFLSISILLWMLGFHTFGLVAAFLLSQLLVSVFLFIRCNLFANLLLTRKHLELVIKNKSFPIFNATSTLLDGITIALPFMFLMMHHSTNDIAIYSVVTRFIAGPLGMIGYAVSQVVLKRTADNVNANNPTLKNHLRLAIYLSISAFGIFILSLLLRLIDSHTMFENILGAEWGNLGIIFIILAPSICVRFVVSSLSPVFSACGHNRLAALWKLFCFVCTIIFFYKSAGKMSFEDLLFSFVIIDVVLYLIYFIASVYAVKFPKKMKV